MADATQGSQDFYTNAYNQAYGGLGSPPMQAFQDANGGTYYGTQPRASQPATSSQSNIPTNIPVIPTIGSGTTLSAQNGFISALPALGGAAAGALLAPQTDYAGKIGSMVGGKALSTGLGAMFGGVAGGASGIGAGNELLGGIGEMGSGLEAGAGGALSDATTSLATPGSIAGEFGIGTGGLASSGSAASNGIMSSGASQAVADGSSLASSLGNGVMSLGAGFIGSTAGGALGGAINPNKSGLGSNIGGTIGGAVGSIFGPVGTLVGSFLGSVAGSFFGPGKPHPTGNAALRPNANGSFDTTFTESYDGFNPDTTAQLKNYAMNALSTQMKADNLTFSTKFLDGFTKGQDQNRNDTKTFGSPFIIGFKDGKDLYTQAPDGTQFVGNDIKKDMQDAYNYMKQQGYLVPNTAENVQAYTARYNQLKPWDDTASKYGLNRNQNLYDMGQDNFNKIVGSDTNPDQFSKSLTVNTKYNPDTNTLTDIQQNNNLDNPESGLASLGGPAQFNLAYNKGQGFVDPTGEQAAYNQRVADYKASQENNVGGAKGGLMVPRRDMTLHRDGYVNKDIPYNQGGMVNNPNDIGTAYKAAGGFIATPYVQGGPVAPLTAPHGFATGGIAIDPRAGPQYREGGQVGQLNTAYLADGGLGAPPQEVMQDDQQAQNPQDQQAEQNQQIAQQAVPAESTADTVPAKLSKGEFVFDAPTVMFYGMGKLLQMQQKAHEAIAKHLAQQEKNQQENQAQGQNAQQQTQSPQGQDQNAPRGLAAPPPPMPASPPPASAPNATEQRIQLTNTSKPHNPFSLMG